MVSMLSAISVALRLVVPWSSSCPVSAATPFLPAGSEAAPEPIISRRLTAGCSSCVTTTTWSPLASVRIS